MTPAQELAFEEIAERTIGEVARVQASFSEYVEGLRIVVDQLKTCLANAEHEENL